MILSGKTISQTSAHASVVVASVIIVATAPRGV
jgi:hypothetical protein